jgi:hypothetical protein
MKVLNLYACLGGNRLLWDNCEVTAVELDPELARLYQERFPNDKVIIAGCTPIFIRPLQRVRLYLEQPTLS